MRSTDSDNIKNKRIQEIAEELNIQNSLDTKVFYY